MMKMPQQKRPTALSVDQHLEELQTNYYRSWGWLDSIAERANAIRAGMDARSQEIRINADTTVTDAETRNIEARIKKMNTLANGETQAYRLAAERNDAKATYLMSEVASAFTFEEACQVLDRQRILLEKRRALTQVTAQIKELETGKTSAFVKLPGMQHGQAQAAADPIVVDFATEDLMDATEFNYSRVLRLAPEQRQAELVKIEQELAGRFPPAAVTTILGKIMDKLVRYA
jgi:hypothetical protein